MGRRCCGGDCMLRVCRLKCVRVAEPGLSTQTEVGALCPQPINSSRHEMAQSNWP